jgi:hypothetical protein
VTTAGSDRSLDYSRGKLHLKKDQVVNYRDIDFIKKALEKNHGYFDIALDFVGGKML